MKKTPRERSDYKKDDSSDKTLLDEALSKSEPLTFPQRRADALVTLAESFLAKTGDRHNEKAELHVHHGRSDAVKGNVQLDANLDGS